MGRHSRPTPAQQARANTLKAAAALGVAGSIAFGLHSSMNGDRSVEARSDVNSAQKQSPDVDPAEDNAPSGSHATPSASKEPRPVRDTPGTPDTASSGRAAHTDGGSGRRAAPDSPATSAPEHTPSDAATAPAQRADQVPTGHTDASQAPGDEATGSSGRPSERPTSPQTKGDDGKGVVGGVVDGVGDTLDGVIGGIGGVLGR